MIESVLSDFYDSSNPSGARQASRGILPTVEVTVRRVGSGSSCPDSEDGVWYVCPRDGTRVKLPRTCDEERSCPKCSRGWAWREAKAVQARLDGVRLLQRLPPARHVVVSFKASAAQSPEDLQEFYGDFVKLLLGVGFDGGWVVYHPDRHEGADCWREGPHGHGLVWGWQDAYPLDDRLVIKQVGVRPDFVPTVSYLLNHAGYAPRAQVGRYFGIAHWRETAVLQPVVEDVQAPVCVVCGGVMVREDQPDGTAGAWRPERVGWAVTSVVARTLGW